MSFDGPVQKTGSGTSSADMSTSKDLLHRPQTRKKTHNTRKSPKDVWEGPSELSFQLLNP